MPAEIRVPPLGESLVDAVVGQWLKQEGDAVTRGETLVELETDKVNLDVTGPEDGALSQIAKQAGAAATVGEVLAAVATAGAAAPPPTGAKETPATVAAPPAPPKPPRPPPTARPPRH